MALQIRNLSLIRNGTATPQQQYEAFSDLIAAVESHGQQTNSTPNGVTPPPPAVNALHVTAKDGVFHAQITDNGQVYRGINYHVQYSTEPAFSSPITVPLGPSRDYRANLGNQGLYWRAYSDYPTSSHSEPVYHGGAQPILVTGGGTGTGPAVPPGQGSGTGLPGQISGHGPVPYRATAGGPPKRQ